MSRHTTYAAFVVVVFAFLFFGCDNAEDSGSDVALDSQADAQSVDDQDPSMGINPNKPHDFVEGDDDAPAMGTESTDPDAWYLGVNPDKPHDFVEGDDDAPAMGTESTDPDPWYVGVNPDKPHDFVEGDDDDDPSMGANGGASSGVAASAPETGADPKKPGEDPYGDEPSMGANDQFDDGEAEEGRDAPRFFDENGRQLPKWLVLYILESREEGEFPGAGPDQE